MERDLCLVREGAVQERVRFALLADVRLSVAEDLSARLQTWYDARDVSVARVQHLAAELLESAHLPNEEGLLSLTAADSPGMVIGRQEDVGENLTEIKAAYVLALALARLAWLAQEHGSEIRWE